MPRTKQAARAYNQRYQAEHRDEMRAKNRAWRAALSELDAWRAVLLAERERALYGPTALYGGRFQQLIADAQAARERQAQRADWQPVGGVGGGSCDADTSDI